MLAENNGSDYALSQVRYIASYGAAYQHESTSSPSPCSWPPSGSKSSPPCTPALAAPACWPSCSPPRTSCPAAAPRSTWSADGSKMSSPSWRTVARTRRALPPQRGVHQLPAGDLDVGERRVQRRLLPAARLRPEAQARRRRRKAAPGDLPGRYWTAARAMAGRVSDWYFSNGKDFSTASPSRSPTSIPRPHCTAAPSFGLNGFLIGRDSERSP